MVEKIKKFNKRGWKAQMWKAKIHGKFENKCYFCGKKNEDKYPILDTHHINPVSELPEDWFKIENGLLLCKDCHIKLHKFIKEIEDKRRKINHPISHTERDKKIKELHSKKHLSYRALANIFHLSQTRIMQVINK